LGLPQVASVVEEVAVTGVGCVMVKLFVMVHPFASVMVQV
jgi:hypothetical protein